MPSKEQRTVFGVLVLPAPDSPGQGQVVMTPTWTLPLSTSLAEIVASALGMYDFFQEQGEAARAEGKAAPRRPVPPSGRPEDYVVFDPDGNELTLQSTIGFVSKPGAVIVISRAIADAAPDQPPAVIAFAAWRSVQDSASFGRYFATRHPDFEPLVGFEFDVFVSFSSEDETRARDLENRLSGSGLRVFLSSKSIEAGAEWSDALRSALRATRLVVVLLTPSSIRSPWVLSEVGAFWALDKPVIPAIADVLPGQLPGPFAQYQARPASSSSEIAALVDEVARLCRA